ARLVSVAFHGPAGGGGGGEPGRGEVSLSRRIPRSFDIYAVRGIAGKLFGLSPLKLQLVWETGEWDPVAGYEDGADGESSDDEAEQQQQQQQQQQRQQRQRQQREGEASHDGEDEAVGADGDARDDHDKGCKSGRWIKREVLLRDGPKQLGYCVDGLDVRIRVEPL
ncbi:hypothetical protein E4U41_002011, partial [Claviceps citrina]